MTDARNAVRHMFVPLPVDLYLSAETHPIVATPTPAAVLTDTRHVDAAWVQQVTSESTGT